MGLLDTLYERVKGRWEERFERRYGFARVRCRKCPQEFLVAFSCKGRGLCPWCGAKRAAESAALLVEEVVEDVGHAQWVFTIPKMLRIYFLHHRELLGKLSQAAAETAKELLAAAALEEKGFGPGVVSVVQTFGDRANFHPHVHAVITRGGWRGSGRWVPVPYADERAAEELFHGGSGGGREDRRGGVSRPGPGADPGPQTPPRALLRRLLEPGPGSAPKGRGSAPG